MNSAFLQSRVYRFLRILLNLAFWLSLAFLFLAFLLGIIVPVLTGGSSVVPDMFGLSMDGLSLKNPAPGSPYNFLVSALTVAVYCVGFLCIWLLRNIVKSLQRDTPFTSANVKRVRMIGWLLFAQAYLHQLMVYSFAKAVADSTVNSIIEPRFQLFPGGAVLAVCILVLAEVFRYGCVLQQEHDTTV